eukprot:1160048-Pelagomonas_calceolata.AAC.5
MNTLVSSTQASTGKPQKSPKHAFHHLSSTLQKPTNNLTWNPCPPTSAQQKATAFVPCIK